jgi:hypothetical protein
VTREPAGLLFGRRLPAVFESFALAGNAASLQRTRIGSMQFGLFSMTGFPVDFRKGQQGFDTMTIDHRSEIDLRTSSASSLQLSHSDSRSIDSQTDLRISSASLRLSRSDSRDISL